MPIREPPSSDRWDARPASPKELPGLKWKGKEIPVAKAVGIPESRPPLGHPVGKVRKDTRGKYVEVMTGNSGDVHQVSDEDVITSASDVAGMEVTLSDASFYHLFPKGKLPRQSIGNCWSVAALISLRKYPYFKAIIQRSIREIFRGGKLVGWTVRFPLGSPVSKKEIGVLRAELSGKGMDAPLGFHILEAVIAKREVQSDRKSTIARYRHDGKLNVEKIMQSGVMSNAFVYLLGNQAKEPKIGKQRTSFSHTSTKVQEEVLDYLRNFNPRRDIATFATPPSDEVHAFTLPGLSYSFFTGHAYALLDVDPESKTVTVQDPNREEAVFLSWDDVLVAFSAIHRVRMFQRDTGKKLHKTA